MSDLWIGIFIGTFVGATLAFWFLVVVPWYTRIVKNRKAKKRVRELLDNLERYTILKEQRK